MSASSPDQITIQPANTVSNAVEQIIALTNNHNFVRPRSSEEIADTILNWHVAVIQEQIVGCITNIPSGSKTHTELGALIVTESGQGISDKLLERFNTSLPTQKAFAIVHKDNTSGRDFFTRESLRASQKDIPDFLLNSDRDMSQRLYFEWEKGSEK